MDNYRKDRDGLSYQADNYPDRSRYDDRTPNRGQYDDRSPNRGQYDDRSDQQPIGGDFIRSDGGPSKQQSSSQGPVNVIMIPRPSLEDKMLIKSINREGFWYRSVPLTLATSGAYYYYNEQKGKPHSIMRYSGLALIAYLVGKFSYLSQAQRRLVESPSNSPFVTELRKRYTGGGYSPYSSGDLIKSGTSEMDWNDPGSSDFTPDAPMLDPDQPSPIHQQTNQSGTLTYDELRAKNRELYEKAGQPTRGF